MGALTRIFGGGNGGGIRLNRSMGQIGVTQDVTQMSRVNSREVGRIGRGLPQKMSTQSLASLKAYNAYAQEQKKLTGEAVAIAKEAMDANVEIHSQRAQHHANAMVAAGSIAKIDAQHGKNVIQYQHGMHVTKQDLAGYAAAYAGQQQRFNLS